MSTWDNLELDQVKIRQDILSQSGDKAAMTFGTLWALVTIRSDNPVQIGLKDLSRLSQVSGPTLVKCIDNLLDYGQLSDAFQKRHSDGSRGDMYYTIQHPPWDTENIAINPQDMDRLDLNLSMLITARMLEWFETRKKHEITASNQTMADWRGIGLRTFKRHKQALMSLEYVYLNGRNNGMIGYLNTSIPEPGAKQFDIPDPKCALELEYAKAMEKVYGFKVWNTQKHHEKFMRRQTWLEREGYLLRNYAMFLATEYQRWIEKTGKSYLYANIFLGNNALDKFCDTFGVLDLRSRSIPCY